MIQKKFSIESVDRCRACGSSDLEMVLDLTDQPPSNSFITAREIADEQKFPLKMHLCKACGLAQLLVTVSREQIFDEYVYLASSSKALCAHYKELVDFSVQKFSPPSNALVVDLGCNDGIMLKCYPSHRYRLLGVDPSSASAQARMAGFDVVQKFFGSGLVPELVDKYGRAAIITSTNVFPHVSDIRDFASGVANWLAKDGVWIIEFSYLVDMVDRCYFDTIYHEHLCYFGLTPLAKMFAEIGLRPFRAEKVEGGASGPSLRLFVCRNDAAHRDEKSIASLLDAERAWNIMSPDRYHAFARRVFQVRHECRAMLADLSRRGERVAGYSAPAKGNTLLNFLGVGPAHIFGIAENNPLKIGKLTPGTHIPVISDADLIASGAKYALLLAWNYAEFFLANTDFIKGGGRFIIPLPKPIIAP
jgi:SAM-dependent methyltransferase